MSQEPRVHVAPRLVKTYGDIAADFSGDYGLVPDPWQQIVLDDWLAETAGKWSSLTCGLSIPRQNGKNALIEMRELFGMVGRGEKILHTAHEVKTAQKHFRRLKEFFGTKACDPSARFPELNELVTQIRSVNGQEAIYLANGGSVELVARSKNSGRGFTVDVLVMDEAQEMSDDALEALMPTTSSAPLGNPQWIFTGTPPGPNANGEIFTRVRSEALEGKSKRLAWHEWSAEVDFDLDDRAQWRRVNPALINGRLQFEVIEGERGRFSDEGFARERLGVWASEAARGVIPAQSWNDREDSSSVATGRFAFGVEVGPDLAWASVVMAGQRPDGDWHLQLAEDQHSKGRGTAWLAPYLEHMVKLNPEIRTVKVDVAGPIKALLTVKGKRLFLGEVEVSPVRVAELEAGCSKVLDGVVTGWLHHIGQPQFTSAALSAGKRAVADHGTWVWSRKSATSDITPIQAGTLALIGAQEDKPVQPMRSWGETGGGGGWVM